MSEKCSLASRTRITAIYARGHLLLAAEGNKPSPCHTVKFTHSFLPVHPPRLALRSCIKSGTICSQVITPYRAVGMFFVGTPIREVTVEHAEGSDRVTVMGIPRPADKGGVLKALAPDDADGLVAGENPFPWGRVVLSSLLDGRFELSAAPPRYATGYSDTFDFNEAFGDALMSLPPSTETVVDALTIVRVTDIGAILGGIAGFHRMFISIEAR